VFDHSFIYGKGMEKMKKRLHRENKVYLITVYEPDAEKWLENKERIT